MLDLKTFGESPAAIILATRINQNNKHLSKIAKMLNVYNLTLKELGKIDTSIGVGLANDVFKKYVKLADRYPIEIKTYLQNVISTKYRNWLKEHNAQLSTEIRKKII